MVGGLPILEAVKWARSCPAGWKGIKNTQSGWAVGCVEKFTDGI